MLCQHFAFGRSEWLFLVLHYEIDLTKDPRHWLRNIDTEIVDEWRVVRDTNFIRGGARSSTKPCNLFANVCDRVSCP